ncbi:MAG: DsbA family protein [Candidatus Nomurabacteria bacterium]|jgi:protein-disulfide isomerase|nr:DsbA family protein [Candidatus Nomurabacteria bacterium]
MPKVKNSPWEVAMSPGAVNKKYKIWAIITTISTIVLAITTTVLVIALVMSVNDANQLRSEQQAKNDPVVDVNDVPLGGVDISTLDGSKLLTQVELGNGEIPDHYVGKKNSKVVVIEYEDFACSHCQALHIYAEQIHADYKDRVLFIHRGFNLGFPNSEKTLRTAEAAYKLGGEEAFWAMLGLLYKDARWLGQEPFGYQAVLNGYAESIGLNTKEFKNAMLLNSVTNKITRDRDLGTAAGVTGTPTWTINGQQIAPRDADIRAALDAAL